MKELSIFIDESGDFGEYNYHSPYYIVSMVFHDQSRSIEEPLGFLEKDLTSIGFPNHCVHSGPIIRREDAYENIDYLVRRKIFNRMVMFVRQIDIAYKCFFIEKKHIEDVIQASGRLSKEIAVFIQSNYEFFLSYDIVKIYYDNGQIELTKIISSVFIVLLPSVEFRKAEPLQYRLSQVADIFCTFELLSLKSQAGIITHSEKLFFGSVEDMKRNYIKPLHRKHFDKRKKN